jgi:hypothetical protein
MYEPAMMQLVFEVRSLMELKRLGRTKHNNPPLN